MLSLGAPLLLAGCVTSQPSAGPVPQVGFAHLPALTFNVARVDVASKYKSPMQAPNAEQRFSAPPERALFDWGLARLKAGGGQGTATFTIEDAAVIETKKPKTPGFKGLFTYEVAERYDARAVASLTLEDPATGNSATVRATAERTIEVRENATLAEREQAWVELVEKLMADFNGEMERQIGMHVSAWLVR